MLYFVIPLRDRSTTADWPGVCRLLERTLASAAGQLDPAWRILVAGHSRPEGIRIPQGCEFLPMPFPPPDLDPQISVESRMQRMRSDKGHKLLHGLARVRAEKGAYVMFLDADDLVSNRLAGYVAAHAGANGWYIDRGYRLDEQPRQMLFWRYGFYKECGSSYLIRADLAPFPERLDDSLDFSDYFVRRYVVHAYIRADLARRGTPLAPLPFYGAIYTFNRRNMFAAGQRRPDPPWRNWARRLLKSRRITPELRREFGLVPLAEPDRAGKDGGDELA